MIERSSAQSVLTDMHAHWPSWQENGFQHVPQLDVTSQSSVKLPQAIPSVAQVVFCQTSRNQRRVPLSLRPENGPRAL
jgi:hypothetical protein